MCLEEQPSQVVTQLYYASVHTKPSVKHAHWLQLLPQQTQGCARTHTDTRTHTHTEWTKIMQSAATATNTPARSRSWN